MRDPLTIVQGSWKVSTPVTASGRLGGPGRHVSSSSAAASLSPRGARSGCTEPWFRVSWRASLTLRVLV